VLFIMSDDFRPELGSYGSKAKTPNLDKLAARSVQFDRMYAQQAVCNPSRSSMLTGRRPDTLKVWNNSLHFREVNPDVTTLPLWFKEHGYTTRCVGKIFHNWHTAEKGDARSWSAPEFLHYANHGDDAPKVEGELPAGEPMLTQLRYGAGPICEALNVPDEAYYDGRVAAEAVRVLGEVKGAPFFLAVGFWKPHAPFRAPKKYWDLYERGDFESFNGARPEKAPEIAFHKSTEILGKAVSAEDLPNAQAAEMRHGYFANVSYLDAQIGKVLEALDASGVAQRTTIVFLSDHGYHLGEHSLWGKTSNFELDARVPFMIAPAGRKPEGAHKIALRAGGLVSNACGFVPSSESVGTRWNKLGSRDCEAGDIHEVGGFFSASQTCLLRPRTRQDPQGHGCECQDGFRALHRMAGLGIGRRCRKRVVCALG
jgi:iduronate 2-sulfatase